jgi:hypothetical protein
MMNSSDCMLYVSLETTYTDTKYFIQKEKSMLKHNNSTSNPMHPCAVCMTNGRRSVCIKG